MTDTELDAIQIILVILVPAIISAGVAIYIARTNKKSRKQQAAESRELDASAAEKISNAYDLVVKNLQNEIIKSRDEHRAELMKIEERQEQLEEKLDKQQKRIVHLESGVAKLVKQIKLLGAEPVFNGFEETEEEI